MHTHARTYTNAYMHTPHPHLVCAEIQLATELARETPPNAPAVFAAGTVRLGVPQL